VASFLDSIQPNPCLGSWNLPIETLTWVFGTMFIEHCDGVVPLSPQAPLRTKSKSKPETTAEQTTQQTEPNRTKPNQIKQTKPNQPKPN
jgi:hypothetical protein